MNFHQGQQVETPLGSGKVQYQRMDPASNYTKALSVSVFLESKANESSYQGTIFPAEQVAPKAGSD